MNLTEFYKNTDMVVNMVSMNTLQFLTCGMIFTGFGWYWGYQQAVNKVVEKVIDHLIRDGFIKTRIDEDGDMEMLKHWEND